MRGGDRQAVYVVAAIVGIACLVVLLLAGFSSDPALHFTAIAATAALLALVAGALAAMFTFRAATYARPAYDAWRQDQLRKPDLRIWLEVADNDKSTPHRLANNDVHIKVNQGQFVLKVAISNGDDDAHARGEIATLTSATLNIAVPLPLDIEPLDGAGKIHYKSVLPAENDGPLAAWYGGTATPCWFTVARTDIGPGHHVFHARVTVPKGKNGPWPFKVALSGFPQSAVPDMPIIGTISRL